MPRYHAETVVATLLLATLPWTIPQVVLGYDSQQENRHLGDLMSNLEKMATIVQELSQMGFDVSSLKKLIGDVKASLDGISSTGSDRELGRVVVYARGLVERLERILPRLVAIAPERPELVLRSLQIIGGMEVLSASGSINSLASSLLESGRNLVEDALTPDLDADHSGRLLSRAATLLAAAQQVVEGGQVTLKVSKAGDSPSNTEVNIAHILTSSQDIKVYQLEERTVYNNDTVVVIRRTIISVGNLTIIERETSRVADGASGSGARAVEFGENVAMGAVIGLKRGAANRIDVEKTEFDVTLQSFSAEASIIRLVLSAPEGTPGRVLVVDIEREAASGLLIKEVAVRLDGKQVKIADSITDILQGSPSEPRYFIALTGSGLQLVIYIPKWSTRVVTIGPAAAQAFYFPVSDLADRSIQWISTVTATVVLVLIAFAGWMRRERARGGSYPPRLNIG
ncbi:MAG: hypothetical protein QXX57_03605 [Nitrososphaerota archaeon]